MSWTKPTGLVSWEISPQPDASSATGRQPELGPLLPPALIIAIPGSSAGPLSAPHLAQRVSPFPINPSMSLHVCPPAAPAPKSSLPIGIHPESAKVLALDSAWDTQGHETQPCSMEPMGRTEPSAPLRAQCCLQVSGNGSVW